MAKKRNIDPRVKPYQNKKGETLYSFQIYVGINPVTGKKLKTRRRGLKTKEKADAELKRLELSIENGEYESGKTTSKKFSEIYDLWYEQYKETVKESTLIQTDISFKYHITPVFKDIYVDKVTVQFCQKAVNKWAKEAPKRFSRHKNYCAKVFDYAISLGIMQDNPMRKIINPSPKKEIETKVENKINFYSKKELQLFLDCSKDSYTYRDYTFFRLLAYSGVRKSEALALTWNDISNVKKQIRVNKTVAIGINKRLLVQYPKTKNSDRIVTMDQDTLDVLSKWRTIQKEKMEKLGYQTLKPNQLVFSNNKNGLIQPSTPSRWMRTIYRDHSEIKKHISVHGFRHTHASLLFESGADIKDVQERLGHADISTTMNIYTHVTDSKRDSSAERFAKFMKENKSKKGSQKESQKNKGSRKKSWNS